jgi:hypothetical protein
VAAGNTASGDVNIGTDMIPKTESSDGSNNPFGSNLITNTNSNSNGNTNGGGGGNSNSGGGSTGGGRSL